MTVQPGLCRTWSKKNRRSVFSERGSNELNAKSLTSFSGGPQLSTAAIIGIIVAVVVLLVVGLVIFVVVRRRKTH